HFSIIMQPGEPAFDEKYYVTDARYILESNATERTEHPPLSKLIIVSGMLIFDDNPLGWRFFSVIFGAACIVLFYLICRQLSMSPNSSLLATFLLATENLSFVQASVAMLDVYSLTFMLAAFYLYLKGRYLSSAVSIGLSTLSKLNGALALPVILLHWFFTGRKRPRRFLVSLFLAPVSFVLLLPLFEFAIWHRFLNPFEQIGKMLNVITSPTFARLPSEMLSRPWEWVLKPEIITYWLDPHYIGMISPTIWALIIPVVLYAAFRAVKGNNTAIFLLSWFTGTYLVWIPVSLLIDRISYVFYFYPAIGAICIGLALGLYRLSGTGGTTRKGLHGKTTEFVIPGYLLLHLVAFVILIPAVYAWKVPICIALYAVARYFLSRDDNPMFLTAPEQC
ncbi:phospholipid carrier-dependent glycosyltransferase, partial [Chloroflexota bacterium]